MGYLGISRDFLSAPGGILTAVPLLVKSYCLTHVTLIKECPHPPPPPGIIPGS